jgi:hypothetical protein
MPQVRRVTDMVIDEISLVDRPANQHATIVLAKRDNQEAAVGSYYDQQGDEVDVNTLEHGDVVFDEDMGVHWWDNGVDDPPEGFVRKEEPEPELVLAKNSPFGAPTRAPASSPSIDTLRQELSKAISDGDHSAVISKALDEIAKFEARTNAAESIAKSERDLRLNREYIAKAAEYNLPVEPDELGPVLKAMWEAEAEHGVLPEGSCAVIHKALSTAGAILFEELGYEGQQAASVGDEVEAYVSQQVDAQVAKGATTLSKAQATREFYRENPQAYAEYLAERG